MENLFTIFVLLKRKRGFICHVETSLSMPHLQNLVKMWKPIFHHTEQPNLNIYAYIYTYIHQVIMAAECQQDLARSFDARQLSN